MAGDNGCADREVDVRAARLTELEEEQMRMGRENSKLKLLYEGMLQEMQREQERATQGSDH